MYRDIVAPNSPGGAVENPFPQARGAPLPSYSWELLRPSSQRQFQLPEALARECRAVVLANEGERLVIAVPDAYQDGLSQRLARGARRPVRLVAASPADIDMALAVCGRGTNPETARLMQLRRLVTDLHLHHVLDEENHRLLFDEERSTTGSRLRAILDNMPGTAALEVMGLLYGLPHLHLSPDQIPGSLRLLLPPSLDNGAESEVVAPLWVEEDTLVIGAADLPPESQLDAIQSRSGFRTRLILVPRADLVRAAELYATSAEDRPQLLPPEKAVQRQRGPAVPQRYMDSLARQTGISPDKVVARFSTFGEDQPTALPSLEYEAGVPGIIPQALALSLGLLPLRLGRGYIEVALADNRVDGRAVADLISTLTGRLVRVHWTTPAALQRALVDAYRHTPGQSSGRAALRLHSRPAILEHNEPYAFQAAVKRIPSIRLEQYGVLPPGATRLTVDHMQLLSALPVREDGPVIWLATTEAGETPLEDLETEVGTPVWPIMVDHGALEDRLAVLSETGGLGSNDGRWDHPVVAYLQANRVMTKTDILRVLCDPGLTIDQSLEKADIITSSQFAQISAQLSKTEVVDLTLQMHEDQIYDALGRLTHRQRWEDPVDETLIELVDAQTAVAVGFLPFQRERGRLLLAVADPFDPRLDGIVSGLREHRPVVVVSPRAELTTAIQRATGNMPLGERLMAHGVISPSDLSAALRLHRTAGIRLGQALLNLGLLTEEQLAFFLAEQRDLPYFSLEGMEPDSVASRLVPEELQRAAGLVPLYQVGDTLAVATADPLNQRALDEVAARTGLDVEPVVCTESELQAMLEVLYRSEYLERSIGDLVSRNPDESASRVITRNQVISISGMALLFLLFFVYSPRQAAILFTAFCSLFYTTFSLYKVYLIYRALSHEFEVDVSQEDLGSLLDINLPVYTILVPLYKEASVLPTLLSGLTRMNYPSSKLDVKLLLEEDDYETREACQAMNLPPYVEAVIVPAAHPRNKPKACNYGLIHARGEYVVIYDAEDIPDPDQLRMAVAAFQKTDEDIVCVQAKLNYYNSHQNLLTAWFTTEYSMWFDLFLPGLDASSAPIPLGGTSNHFPTARLREVGAWDPYNVTEDADLGLRLYRRGGKTAIIDSTTLEEANSEVYNWIRQRSRWVKGYIQTYLVHMRHPIQLLRAIGPKAFFEFQMVIGGTFFSFLLNPVFWGLTALWYLVHAGFIHDIFPPQIYYLGITSLTLGNFAFIYLNVAGCLRRGYWSMVKYALVVPLYWALMSIAAWKGFIQLAYRPFYWEKTVHGLYKPDAIDDSAA